jgi:hypothetical protein
MEFNSNQTLKINQKAFANYKVHEVYVVRLQMLPKCTTISMV